MAQMTWRADDDLLEHVRFQAAEHGKSMNDFVTTVLRTVTDPDHAEPGVERLRARLARAGLLATPTRQGEAPDQAAFEAARARAGTGTPLSDTVSAERG